MNPLWYLVYFATLSRELPIPAVPFDDLIETFDTRQNAITWDSTWSAVIG
jgi:hypothetical protein